MKCNCGGDSAAFSCRLLNVYCGPTRLKAYTHHSSKKKNNMPCTHNKRILFVSAERASYVRSTFVCVNCHRKTVFDVCKCAKIDLFHHLQFGFNVYIRLVCHFSLKFSHFHLDYHHFIVDFGLIVSILRGRIHQSAIVLCFYFWEDKEAAFWDIHFWQKSFAFSCFQSCFLFCSFISTGCTLNDQNEWKCWRFSNANGQISCVSTEFTGPTRTNVTWTISNYSTR